MGEVSGEVREGCRVRRGGRGRMNDKEGVMFWLGKELRDVF